ncbi:MAG: multicopper oxidase domain-containing protein [Candidatus Sulfomarinibacteraceae bacterium]
MERKWLYTTLMAVAVLLVLIAAPAGASHINVQCPGDTNGNALQDGGEVWPANQKCMHLTSGDGYVTMADGTVMYMFGFADATGWDPANVMVDGILAGAYPGPIIVVDEDDEFYLSLSNVGMLVRPDLFDPHTVHWHGFPQASSVFDGLPESGLAINMGATLTYYYNVKDPGTYMYHCHVEATEHMQMGMLANLYVRPKQNKLPNGTVLAGGFVHTTGNMYAYNDGDGSTRYDVEVPIQMSSFDSAFHNASESVQPLPFALMRDDYPMINGRGYPDTVVKAPLPAPAENGGKVSQFEDALIEAAPGQRVLLRISNISITKYFTLQSLGVPMTVVGRDARLLRGPGGENLYYNTNSVTLGGGETNDVIVEIPSDAQIGDTYFLYTSNLNYLSNGTEEFGGMMTEIRVSASAMMLN